MGCHTWNSIPLYQVKCSLIGLLIMQYQKYQLMMELENKSDATIIEQQESDELLQNITPRNPSTQNIIQSNKKPIYLATIIILAILVFNLSLKNRKAQTLEIILDQTQNNVETTSIRSNQEKEEPSKLNFSPNILFKNEKISSKSYEDDNLQFQKQQPQKYTFFIPRKVWIYNASQFSYINELIIQNNVKFSRKLYYQLQYINQHNYQRFLHNNAFTKLSSVINLLRQRANKENNDALKMNLNKIIRTIILLNVVHQNGGICTDGESIIVEDFGWIKNIVDNIHASHGRNRILPKVIGFYNPELSPNKKKFTMKPKAGMQQVDKFKTEIPILQNYFIAADEKAQFLQAMINKIYEMLQNPSSFTFKHLSQYKVKKAIKQMNIYQSYFYLSSAIVLQQKQKYLDERFKGQIKNFAIDFYGVYCINQNYGPSKIQQFYPDQLKGGLFNQTLNLLAYSSQQDMIIETGKIRYLTRLTPLNRFNQFLNNLQLNKQKAVFEGSFIQKMLFPSNPKKLVTTNPKKYFVNYTNQQWNFLPRIIWVFSSNDKITPTLLNNNIKNYSKAEKFQVRQVNINNLKEYLDDDVIEKFNRLVHNSKHSDIINLQKKLAKLAILYRYGGVFLQNSFLLGDLKWLLNIGQLPSSQVTNRFGYLPKMLLNYHPQQKQINERTVIPISPSRTITASSLLNYDESFIAVEKDHQLIKEWYDNLFMSLEARQSKPNGEYHFCKQLKQISDQAFDIPIASLLCVLHKRNLKLAESQQKTHMNAEDYYKLWSMNGYVSQQKLTSHLNFDNFESDDQVYLYRYSQQYVQGIVGDLKHFLTLDQEQMQSLQAFAVSNFHDFTAAAHSKSIFSRHLWRSEYTVSNQSRGYILNIEYKQ